MIFQGVEKIPKTKCELLVKSMKPVEPACEAIIQEIMKNEGLRSPRQVFEKYPRLGDWWNGILTHATTDDRPEEGERRGSDNKF
jgi:hypothetical protein